MTQIDPSLPNCWGKMACFFAWTQWNSRFIACFRVWRCTKPGLRLSQSTEWPSLVTAEERDVVIQPNDGCNTGAATSRSLFSQEPLKNFTKLAMQVKLYRLCWAVAQLHRVLQIGRSWIAQRPVKAPLRRFCRQNKGLTFPQSRWAEGLPPKMPAGGTNMNRWI